MTILRSKAEFCSRKMLEASIALTKELSKIQQPYVSMEYVHDDDRLLPVARVPIEISIPQHIRSALWDVKSHIEDILRECNNDKGF